MRQKAEIAISEWVSGSVRAGAEESRGLLVLTKAQCVSGCNKFLDPIQHRTDRYEAKN